MDGIQYARLSFLLLRSLETDNERNLEVEFLSGFDDTFGDVITSHDT